MAKAKFHHTSEADLASRSAELFELQEAFDALLTVADRLTKQSRYKALGLTALEEGKLWFEKALVTDSVGTFK